MIAPGEAGCAGLDVLRPSIKRLAAMRCGWSAAKRKRKTWGMAALCPSDAAVDLGEVGNIAALGPQRRQGPKFIVKPKRHKAIYINGIANISGRRRGFTVAGRFDRRPRHIAGQRAKILQLGFAAGQRPCW